VTTVLLHGLGADRRQPLGLFETVIQDVAGPDELVIAPDVRAHGGFLAVGEPADFAIDRLAGEVCEHVPVAEQWAGGLGSPMELVPGRDDGLAAQTAALRERVARWLRR
jgi:hypothetical protein